jgi:superfamily II DNA or RNA helicase
MFHTPKSFTPWICQEECRQALLSTRRLAGTMPAKALVVMASGCGKTAAAAFDVQNFFKTKPHARFLCLCDQNHVLLQNMKTFHAILGGAAADYGFYHGGEKKRHAKYLFATFQSVLNNLEGFRPDEYDYIFIDEGHHSQANTYRSVIEHFIPRFLLAMTATPDRSDTKDIRDMFGDPVYSLELPEAIAKGYLTPIEYRLLTDEVVEFGKIKNPYVLTVAQLNRRIFVPRRDKEIVRIIAAKTAHITTPRMIVFCNSITHAEKFARHIDGALTVHSGQKMAEQERRISMFENHKVSTLVTVDKFNEGVDLPDVNIVVFLRLTSSRTVFFQQLGRGLRKSDNKKSLLALDFAGNCERLRMVSKVQREVAAWAAQSDRTSGGADSGEVRVFSGGQFLFSEQIMDILAFYDKARFTTDGGYTRDILISLLQAEARSLGRTPSSDDIIEASKAGRTASITAYRDHFGSLTAALVEAGLCSLPVSFSRSDLIKQLQDEAVLLGRSPRWNDICAAAAEKRAAPVSRFQTEFGPWNKALEAAGLSSNRNATYSSADLIAQLKDSKLRLGRVPTSKDFGLSSNDGITASTSAFLRVFGTWNDGLRQAGMVPMRVRHDERALLLQLKQEATRLGRTPCRQDIVIASSAGRTASPATYVTRFGSVNDALIAAGFKPSRRSRPRRDKDVLILQLKREAELLGKRPSVRDMDSAASIGRAASGTTYRAHFGSFNNALIEAGFLPPNEG